MRSSRGNRHASSGRHTMRMLVLEPEVAAAASMLELALKWKGAHAGEQQGLGVGRQGPGHAQRAIVVLGEEQGGVLASEAAVEGEVFRGQELQHLQDDGAGEGGQWRRLLVLLVLARVCVGWLPGASASRAVFTYCCASSDVAVCF